MELLLHRADLRLRHTFTIAHDSRDVQETLIVELRDGPLSGFGEATANPYYGITIDRMMEDLGRVRDLIDTPWTTAEALWELVHNALATNPFAQCALDEAAHDLVAKRAGQPLYAHWGLDLTTPTHRTARPLTNFTIGIDTPEVMLAKMQAMPWPLYKIKLGRPESDLDVLRLLRKHTDARFRVDANCGWTVDQTLAFTPELVALGVEFVEQPLPSDDWDGMARLRAELPKKLPTDATLPLIADESCITEADVARCAGYFDGINIKLTKCGGLTPARRMIAEARQLGLCVMVGCMTESSVGISAIAHLLPLLDYVDMDGSLLITNDPATGVTFDYGVVNYVAANGTGAVLRA